MTRISDAVWNHFKKSPERKKNITTGVLQHFLATCNYCEITMSGQPKRMKAHLKNCPNAPLEIKEQYSEPKNKEQETSEIDDKINKKETDIKLARAFYASGIPLAVIENPFFVQALHQINPEYNPPSRKVLSTRLLEREYKQISIDVKKLVKNANYICLTSDGWTNIHQEPIINFTVTTPQPIFWKALETKEISHTGDYIAQQFEIVIEEIGMSKIAAVITDNASNMKKAHRILLNKYPNIIFLGNNFNLILCFFKNNF